MKNLYLVLFAFCVAGIHGQSFHQGALITSFNGGLEIYNTQLQVYYKPTGKDTVTNDKTGNFHYAVGAEYGLLKNLGAGIRFKGANFFVEKDTSGLGQETVKSTDIVAQFVYHPYSKKVFDLALGTDIGYSSFILQDNDAKKTVVRGKGLYYSFFINPRLYIGRFGFNMNLYLPFFSYPDLVSSDPDFTRDYSYGLKAFPGFGLNFGIQFRFLKPVGDGAGKTEIKE